MPSDRHAVTRRIAVPADTIWAVVSDPAGHVRIDGSGMLQTALDTTPITVAGQTFDLHMDRRPLGDIPGMEDYTVRNTVTRVEPGRLVEWTVSLVGKAPVGHVYGWLLEPVGDETDVTNYCDWSGITDEMRNSRTWPVVPVTMLEESIARLELVIAEG